MAWGIRISADFNKTVLIERRGFVMARHAHGNVLFLLHQGGELLSSAWRNGKCTYFVRVAGVAPAHSCCVAIGMPRRYRRFYLSSIYFGETRADERAPLARCVATPAMPPANVVERSSRRRLEKMAAHAYQ